MRLCSPTNSPASTCDDVIPICFGRLITGHPFELTGNATPECMHCTEVLGRLLNDWASTYMRALVFLAIAATSAYAGAPKVFEGSCGATKFRVTAVNSGTPLENVFTLAVITPSGAKTLYVGDEGGWFHAACLPAKQGKSILVFQSYCGGSVCREGMYGAVDPNTLKLLLRPSSKNVENHKKLSALLGSPAPHLGEYKGAFCCEQ